MACVKIAVNFVFSVSKELSNNLSNYEVFKKVFFFEFRLALCSVVKDYHVNTISKIFRKAK